ncbi:MAG: histidinol-phosphatase HisJ family protein [Lachnospiraceae bacterium]|nr:histidinol-phosphatase HisJ family protein [Lachnospiraceae bacterium]
MITADFHLHSSHSEDSQTPMEQQIEAGIKAGLKYMCFTEHMDKDWPKDAVPLKEDGTPDIKDLSAFEVDTDAYFKHLTELKGTYSGRVDLRFGIEYGCQTHLAQHNIDYVNQYPFDFVIASQHLVNGIDVYYPEYFEGKSEHEAYLAYFEAVLESICIFSGYDIFGHIDYIVRYGPNKNKDYFYKDYADVLDEILKRLIMNGKGIEINTAGYRKLGDSPNPSREILKRYRELGGEIITVGSDAHTTGSVAFAFDKAESLLKELGYTHYCIFKERRPEFLPLF